jgi:hypothetical protein
MRTFSLTNLEIDKKRRVPMQEARGKEDAAVPAAVLRNEFSW